MQRLTDIEIEIIELLHKAQTEVSKGCIMGTLNRDQTLTAMHLGRLARLGYICENKQCGFTYYTINESNKQMKTKQVKCPKCKHIRRVFNEAQVIALCKNRNCRTPKGSRTVYRLQTKCADGITRKINHV